MKTQTPSESNWHAVLERDPEFAHTRVQYAPAERFTNVLFLFFCFLSRYLNFVFGGILGSQGIPHFQQNTHTRNMLGMGTLKTRAELQALSLKNTLDILTFVRECANITAWHRNYLILMYLRFWALSCNCWSFVRSRFFEISARKNVQTCLGASGSGSSKKKNPLFFLSIIREIPVIGRDTFSALAPVVGPQHKNGCHPLPLFTVVSIIRKYVTFELLYEYCMRHSWLTNFGGLLFLNQLILVAQSICFK